MDLLVAVLVGVLTYGVTLLAFSPLGWLPTAMLRHREGLASASRRLKTAEWGRKFTAMRTGGPVFSFGTGIYVFFEDSRLLWSFTLVGFVIGMLRFLQLEKQSITSTDVE